MKELLIFIGGIVVGFNLWLIIKVYAASRHSQAVREHWRQEWQRGGEWTDLEMREAVDAARNYAINWSPEDE